MTVAVTISSNISLPLSSSSLFQTKTNENSVVLELVEGTNYFQDQGTAIWSDVDLGQFVVGSIKVIYTAVLSTNVLIETATSPDRITYSAYEPLSSDGSVISPVARYLRVRVTLVGQRTNRGQFINEFSDAEKTQFDETILFSNGSISSPNNRNFALTAETTWNDGGYMYRFSIDKSKFKSFFSVSFLQ